MGLSKKALFFVIASAVPAMVACNAILGIDDFTKGQCETVPCEPPEGGPDQIVPDRYRPDTNDPDTGPDAPPGVGPVSWAQFPMPNYKSTVDAGTTVRPLDYTENTADVITDDVTGLVWRRKVVGVTGTNTFGDDKTQDSARDECAKLSDGPWRLPKRIELVTLLSYGHPPPFIDTVAFTGVGEIRVWTSSEVRPVAGKFWGVDFGTGALVQLDRNNSPAKVLCVKDKQ
jgi:hypothetical protein